MGRVFCILLLFILTLSGCAAPAEYGAFQDAYDRTEAEIQIVWKDTDTLSGELKRIQQETDDLLARMQKEDDKIAKLLAQSDPTKDNSATNEVEHATQAPSLHRGRKHGYR